MSTAITTAKPVQLSAEGKAISNFETIEVPLPEFSLGRPSSLRINVGLFPRTAATLPGWRAEASAGIATCHSGQPLDGGTRERAIVEAVEKLINRLVDWSDISSGDSRKRAKAIAAAVVAWLERFEKETAQKARKENTAMVTARQKILDAKECRYLLEDFKRSYDGLRHAFLELGEKAQKIQEQEAFAEKFATFDEWIKSEEFDRSVVYGCMKAVRLDRLMAPFAQKAQIVLDCESHYRAFPADVTSTQARAIAGKLETLVELGEDGQRHPTARHVRAAVEAVCPKSGSQRLEGSGQRSAVSGQRSAISDQRSAISGQRSETIEAEFAEVRDVHEADSEAEVPMVDIGVMDSWTIRFALPAGVPAEDRKIAGFGICLRQALKFEALMSCDRGELARLFRSLADELDPPRRPR